MSAMAGLRRFASTRQGKVVLGGGAALGVTGLALANRKKVNAGGGAVAPPTDLLGASGSSSGYAGYGSGATIDMGQFEDLLRGIGDQSDQVGDGLSPEDRAVRDAFRAYSPTQADIVTQDPDKYAKWVAIARVEGIDSATSQIKTRSEAAAKHAAAMKKK